jgi:hypothetical protein
LRGTGTAAATGAITVATAAHVGFASGASPSDVLTLATGPNDAVGGGSGSVITVSGAGKVVLTQIGSYSGTWSIGSGATLQLAPAQTHVLRTPGITINAGRLDIQDNKIITTMPVGIFNGSTYSDVTGLIESGRNGGGWTGSGIVTSQSSATSGNSTSIGIATASQVKGITASATATWAGQTVTGTDTLVMYTYTGDANLDGKVNADDYFQIDSHYNKSANSAKSWFNGDFNYDGKINGDDYFLIDNAFAGQAAPFSDGTLPDGVSSVPEPAMGMELIIVAATMMRRRRRTLLLS